MSIPLTFDPMGTLEHERPYVQPIMTSETTWSNKPSFGMTVTGETFFSGGEPWVIFSEKEGNWIVSGTGHAFLNFTKPLKITRIALDFSTVTVDRILSGNFSAYVNNQWVKIGSYSYYHFGYQHRRNCD